MRHRFLAWLDALFPAWDRFARRRPWAARGIGAAAAAVPVLIYLHPYLKNPTFVGAFGDIRNFHFWWEVSRKTVLEFGQLPFWNPYYCGGMVHWANVQTMFLSPTFLVNLLFGAGVGIRVHIFVHYIAGFAGCVVLARHRRMRGLWALAPAVAFVFGANMAERTTGHLSFMPFMLLPWLLYLFERSRTRPHYGAIAGLLLAYCVLAGGPYPFAMMLVYVALLVVVEQPAAWWRWRRRKAHRRGGRRKVLWPIRFGLLALAVGVSVGAVKLFVVLDFMSQYPRLITEQDHLQPWQIWEVFLEPDLVRHRKGYFYVFGEYRNYLGPAVMVALPLMVLRLRARWRDFTMVALCGLFMAGSFAPWSPYSLSQHLPVFKSLRVPVRYAILVDLHLALLFGHALQSAARWLGRFDRRPVLIAGVAALTGWLGVATAELMVTTTTQLKRVFTVDPSVPPREGPFRMIHGNSTNVYRGPPRNEGHIRCYEPNPLRISPQLRAFGDAQVWLGTTLGSATLVRWSPNVLEVDVTSEGPATLIINQNYHRDWRVEGGELTQHRGLLAATVSGASRVTLSYVPRRFGGYASVSGLALVLVGFGIWRGERRARRERKKRRRRR